jgi:uncharacterized membrane protein
MSGRKLKITLIVLTVIGIGLATYLTYIHYADIKPLCGRNGGSCLKVQSSVYSKLDGIPVALIGLIGYVIILGSLLVPDGERARFLTAALTLGGFGFSAYLTYREVFTLKEICEYCVSSAILMTIMMGLSVWRFLIGDSPEQTIADQPSARSEQTAPLGTAS